MAKNEKGPKLTIAGMPRPLRIQYAGARYQVMSRSDRREAIFYRDAVKSYRFKKPVEF